MKHLLFFAFIFLLNLSRMNAQSNATLVVHDQLVAARSAVLHGHIADKLDLSYTNRVLAQDVDHLVAPFLSRTETRQWQSEFWGKWFTSAVLAYKYKPTPQLKKVLKEAVEKLIATQTPDGYIGNYAVAHRLQQWDIWGRKYCMLGLLDYYDLENDKASLNAAKKIADHLIKEIKESDGLIINKGNFRGMAASSVLEPMVRLYVRTKDKKYLDFSEEIVRQWETSEGPHLNSNANVNVSDRFPKPKVWFSWEQGQKAYEMMSCYEGLLELFRVTGNKNYQQAVENTWENILEEEINIAGSGAAEEMWFGGKKLQVLPITHYQETCVTVTWLKLNQQLLRLTGEVKYADEIERTYYNALLGSLSNDAADWAVYTPLNGQRLPGSNQCGMDLNCCKASGPRGQFTLPLTAVMESEKGLSVNFFVAGTYQLNTPAGKQVTITQNTDYPVTGRISLSVNLTHAQEMALQFRIPAWSKVSQVTVNGEEVTNVVPGQYLVIKRKWSSKDIIILDLDMRGRVTIQGDDRKFAAITRGPVVLARDARFAGPPLTMALRPVVDKDGYIPLKPVAGNNNDEFWMQYTAAFVPESNTVPAAAAVEIGLCDYASAGKGSGSPPFQVWISQLFSARETIK